VLVFRGNFIILIEHKLSADKDMGIHFMENQQNAIKYVQATVHRDKFL